MSILYGRFYSLTIGQPGQAGKQWVGRLEDPNAISISFDVERKNSGAANKLRLQMFNLSAASIGFIEQEGNVITLIAGYRNESGLIFQGTIARQAVTSEKPRDTRITTIEAGANERELQTARTSKSYAAGVSIRRVLQDVAGDLSVGITGLELISGIDKTFSTGWTFFGNARDAVGEIVEQLGPDFRWTIEDGQLQILDGSQTLANQGIVLRSDDTVNTGVIGSPKRQKDGIEVVSFLRSTLKPGITVQVLSKAANGFYKVQQAKHVGAFPDGDWQTTIQCQEVKF